MKRQKDRPSDKPVKGRLRSSQPAAGTGPGGEAASECGGWRRSAWKGNWLWGLLLVAGTFAVYWQVSSFEFTNFDESRMILSNPFVLGGLTRPGFAWALTTSWFEYWHPLTWLSHMLDCELFGLRPGGHHLVSLGFHAANTLLLFAVLQRMTGARNRSAMVAALFALHPLHVESVAWIAERKDVLSGFFFMLTLWAYVRYAEGRTQNTESSDTPHAARATRPVSILHPPSSTFYVLSLLFFACGLMSKPMLVTVPFVLLLLDYWPLRRLSLPLLQHSNTPTLQHSTTPSLRLIWEKLPFFALTVVSCAITYTWAINSGNIMSAEKVPWGLRLANVPVSYVRYLGKMIWPADLAVVYPMPSHWAWWQAAGAVVVLVLITRFAVRRARSAPYGLVGWLIFLGMLFPTMRLVQSGYQSIADRYTYLPLIGLFIVLAWGTHDLIWHRGPRHRVVLVVAGLAMLIGCAGATRLQAGYWKTSESLFTHALAVTENNYVAHNNLGNALRQKGRLDEAMAHFKKALEIQPDFAEAHVNLGNLLLGEGQAREALSHYRRAIEIKPDFADARIGLANLLSQTGELSEARAQLERALEIQPDNVMAHNNLGNALLQKGQVDEAIAHYRKAVGIQPGYANAHNSLANALLQKGQVDEAIVHYRKALEIEPGFAQARQNLASVLARKGEVREGPVPGGNAAASKPDGADADNEQGSALVREGRLDEAMASFRKALAARPSLAAAHYNLANVLGQKKQIDEAIVHYQKALETQPDFAMAHNNLAGVLMQKGQVSEAIVHYQKALETQPDYAMAHDNLASALLQAGRADEAIPQYQKALEIRPDNAEARDGLGVALMQKQRVDEALAQFKRAVEIRPDFAVAHHDLGRALLQKGKVGEALVHLQTAVKIQPDFGPACISLAWVLATSPDPSVRNGARAVELARRAEQLIGGKNPLVLRTLAAACAESGRFTEALAAAQKAHDLALAQGDRALAAKSLELLERFRTGRPFHEGP